MSVNVAALIIACLALILSVYEGSKTREHNRLSVRPQLEFSIGHNPSGGPLEFRVTNCGLGPAVKLTMRAGLEGKPRRAVRYRGFLDTLEEAGLLELDGDHEFPGVLVAGESTTLLRVTVSDFVTYSRFVAGVQRLRIEIDYESMYGERFSVASDELQEELKEALAAKPPVLSPRK